MIADHTLPYLGYHLTLPLIAITLFLSYYILSYLILLCPILHCTAGVPTSEFRARKILTGLGFTDDMMNNPTAGLRYAGLAVIVYYDTMLCCDACMGMRMRASEEAYEKESILVRKEIEYHLIVVHTMASICSVVGGQ